jgi:hypothetical protein
LLFVIAGGIAAGLAHVFSGPDHLAAVAPLAMKPTGRAWRTGLGWGLGHASGVVFVGAISLCLRELVPVDSISSYSDRLVGALLIGIGLWTLRNALRVHAHQHVHEGGTHAHIHVHGCAGAKRRDTPPAHLHSHAAFGIGSLHGLAGSAHFLAIIPSLAMPSTVLSFSYLMAYGIGTVLSMIVFASVVQLFSLRFARGAVFYRRCLFVCSATAIAVGSGWLLGFSF